MRPETSENLPADCSAACRQIQVAATHGEVVDIVSGYLASLDPAHVAAIPVSLANLQARQARDIAAAALDLAHHEMSLAHDAPETAMVKSVSRVMSTAAMRLAILSA